MGSAYDVIVIGSGPAGQQGALQAASFGARVALIERAPHLGGAGINTGTVPSKTLRETALYFSGLRQRGLYGIDYSLREGLTVDEFMHRKQVVIEHEWSLISKALDAHHVTLVRGDATLRDAHHVQVTAPGGEVQVLETSCLLIATGSSPYHPKDIPIDRDVTHDSDSILHLSRLPRTMAVLGGGVIGCEYASLFTALGVQVTLVEGHDRLLPFVDSEIAERLRAQLATLGLRFLFGQRVAHVERAEACVGLQLSGGEALSVDVALFATGRQANTASLGLEAVGVELGEHGTIKVDEVFRTSVEGLYAAGDVVGFPALASTSMEQGRIAMAHAFDPRFDERVPALLPLAVYTIPEIGMVGQTEDALRAKGTPYLVGRATYEANARGQIIGDLHGLVKLLFSPTDGTLLGVHQLGELSSELVHLGAQAMALGGTVKTLADAVFNYPTLAGCYEAAALDGLSTWEAWRKAQASQAAG